MEIVNQDIKDFEYYMTHSKSLTIEQKKKIDLLLARDLSIPKAAKPLSRSVEYDIDLLKNRILVGLNIYCI